MFEWQSGSSTTAVGLWNERRIKEGERFELWQPVESGRMKEAKTFHLHSRWWWFLIKWSKLFFSVSICLSFSHSIARYSKFNDHHQFTIHSDVYIFFFLCMKWENLFFLFSHPIVAALVYDFFLLLFGKDFFWIGKKWNFSL